MDEPETAEEAFVDFDAYLPKPHRVIALLEAFGALVGTVSFVLLSAVVLGRQSLRC